MTHKCVSFLHARKQMVMDKLHSTSSYKEINECIGELQDIAEAFLDLEQDVCLGKCENCTCDK